MTQKFPTWRQGLILLASAIVLGVGCCAGFATNIEGSMAIPFAIGFGICVLAFLVAIIFLIVRALRTSGSTPPAAGDSPPGPV